MTPADHARNAAISLEVKKDGLFQKQSGDWKVSFTAQGIDMDPRLTQAAMGTRFAMVLVEIGDNELPVQQKEARAEQPRQDTPMPPSKPDGAAKRDWRDVPPGQQAGICCGQPAFADFLKETRPDDWHEAMGSPEECVRLICGVASRGYLGHDHRARVLWHQLDSQYQAWRVKERA